MPQFLKRISKPALYIILCAAFTISPALVDGWGFYVHRKINRLAVFTLPEPVFGFYRHHIEFIAEHAVDPDKRRYSAVGEAEKHYIDIDHYCKDPFCDPFEIVPQRWDEAVAKFSEDTLRAYGIVPWNLEWVVRDLTLAFRNKNESRILRLSSEMGHYVGDASVPLHTTENYNGQMTNQRGIHAFWESRLPELFDGEYDLFTGKAEYVDNVSLTVWEMVMESHRAVDSVLRFEAELSKDWPEDVKYAFEERGMALIKNYSREFSREYHNRLNGMVERRMKKAIKMIGDLWYTAWVDAGQPDLREFYDKQVPEELLEEIAREGQLPNNPNLMGRPHENE